MTTRDVEIFTKLEVFLNVMKKFFGRSGLVNHIYYDGTNFVGFAL